MQNERQDVYTRITDRIVADLEQGVRTWMKPWNAGNTAGRIVRPLRFNGVPYSGINILMLWAESVANGFTSPTWMTFRQASELNAHVRKGEKGSLVVYANSITRTEEGEQGEESEREIHYMKGYTVFNVEQIEGLPESHYAKPEITTTPVERIARAEAFFAATKADVRYRGDRAFYSNDGDYIQMPVIEAFRDAESFYATLAHESAHWTKHPTRLDRSFGRKAWGDEGYAREELIAELSSAFLCADLGITPEVRDDHASYIATWLTVLKNDKRAIFTAASHAQKAVDFLHGLKSSILNATEKTRALKRAPKGFRSHVARRRRRRVLYLFSLIVASLAFTDKSKPPSLSCPTSELPLAGTGTTCSTAGVTPSATTVASHALIWSPSSVGSGITNGLSLDTLPD
jgi:antirestriction protein ArdC